LLRLATGNDRCTTTFLHELVERQLEAVLATVGANGSGIVGHIGKSAVKNRLADTFGSGFALEGINPLRKTSRRIATLRSHYRPSHQTGKHRHTKGKYLHCPHQKFVLDCYFRGASPLTAHGLVAAYKL
jgi:hypothetical protein